MVDCGSGARNAAIKLLNDGVKELDIFYSHFHLDHICGLPFFCPVLGASANLKCQSPILDENFTLQTAADKFISPPVFPVTIAEFPSLSISDFNVGAKFSPIPRLEIETIQLHHPGGCCGYKFSYRGKSICIIADHEHGNAEIDAEVQRFVSGADIMVYDGMYSDDEYEKFKGWGHSTWQEGLQLAKQVNVKLPIITHHAPKHPDQKLDEIAKQVKNLYPKGQLAIEGATYQLT